MEEEPALLLGVDGECGHINMSLSVMFLSVAVIIANMGFDAD